MATELEKLTAAFANGTATQDQKNQLGQLLAAAATAVQGPKPIPFSFKAMAAEKRGRLDRFASAITEGKENRLQQALDAAGWKAATGGNAGIKYYTNASDPLLSLRVSEKSFKVLKDGEVHVAESPIENLIAYLGDAKTQTNLPAPKPAAPGAPAGKTPMQPAVPVAPKGKDGMAIKTRFTGIGGRNW